jgi:hypothetical protein
LRQPECDLGRVRVGRHADVDDAGTRKSPPSLTSSTSTQRTFLNRKYPNNAIAPGTTRAMGDSRAAPRVSTLEKKNARNPNQIVGKTYL